jgi:hypothetical protein
MSRKSAPPDERILLDLLREAHHLLGLPDLDIGITQKILDIVNRYHRFTAHRVRSLSPIASVSSREARRGRKFALGLASWLERIIKATEGEADSFDAVALRWVGLHLFDPNGVPAKRLNGEPSCAVPIGINSRVLVNALNILTQRAGDWAGASNDLKVIERRWTSSRAPSPETVLIRRSIELYEQFPHGVNCNGFVRRVGLIAGIELSADTIKSEARRLKRSPVRRR